MALGGGLYRQMIARCQCAGIDEIIWQGGLCTEAFAEQAIGVIAHLLLAARAIGAQHMAGVAIGEDGLHPARHIAGEQRNGAGRRDGGDKSVANAVGRDLPADFRRQGGDEGPRQKSLALEQREGAFLRRQIGGGVIGGM